MNSVREKLGVSGKQNELYTYSYLVFRDQMENSLFDPPEVCLRELFKFLFPHQCPRIFRHPKKALNFVKIKDFADYMELPTYEQTEYFERRAEALQFQKAGKMVFNQNALTSALKTVNNMTKSRKNRLVEAEKELKELVETLKIPTTEVNTKSGKVERSKHVRLIAKQTEIKVRILCSFTTFYYT